MLPVEKQSKSQQTVNHKPQTVDLHYSFDGLTNAHIRAYGIGHTLNDLVITCSYAYFLYFFKKILMIEFAAQIMLINEVVDGVLTPIIGYFSGKCETRIGKRKPWYIASIFLIAISNLLLYSGFKSENEQLEKLFYISATVLFCFGFATMEINHMSLVPALTCSRKRRDQLNNLRTLFTFASNFIVLGFGLLVFSFIDGKLLEYKIINYSCVLIGVLASVYFVCTINESQLTDICKAKQLELKKLLQQQKSIILALQNESPVCQLVINLPQNQESVSICHISLQIANQPPKSLDPVSNSQTVIQCENVQKPDQSPEAQESVLDWLKIPKFYLYGVCYAGAQMYVCMFGTLIPFYITDVLKMVENTDQKVSFNLALIPMLVRIGAVLISCKIDHLYEKIGRKWSLLLGTLLCIIGSASMVVIDESHAKYFYGVVVVIGVSQSLVLSTSFTMISDVVETKEKSGTFVFGVYSMLEKIAIGFCIYFVTGAEAYSKTSDLITESDRNYIKWTTILVPSISCFVTSIILAATSVKEYTNLEQEGKAVNKTTALQKELIL